MPQEQISLIKHFEQVINDLKELIDTKFKENENAHYSVVSSIDKMNETLKSHNGRLTKMETWQNRVIGALTILSVLVGSLIFPLVIKFFDRII